MKNNITINLKFKKENLPHLIGLHKLSECYSEIRQMEDKNDHTITPKNIFEILRAHNIDYDNLKSSSGWTTHLQNRMENFTYKKLDSILRKATMFGFIYEEGKTKNTKAKYVLIDKIQELFLQFYIGYDEKTKEYFPNSYVPNNEKDPNLSRDTLKIIRTEIYNETPSERVKIETIEHEKIRELTQLIKENLTSYNNKNNQMYNLIKEDKPNEDMLKEINSLIAEIIKSYKELAEYVNIDIFLNNKSNGKLKRFLESARIIPIS
ncbi:hypothetical protein HGI34_21560 [Clostridium saccharobutylicum]|nr:hypothetical protein [Clostridium saccharobutylicum]